MVLKGGGGGGGETFVVNAYYSGLLTAMGNLNRYLQIKMCFVVVVVVKDKYLARWDKHD